MSYGPLVTCTQCNGAGRCGLTPPMRRTYNRLTHEWQSTEEIHVASVPDPVLRTALIGRLETLRNFGLVERRKNEDGRGLQWRRLP